MLEGTCIIIPTYNEAENIERLVEALLAFSPAGVIVVDDDSPDGTSDKTEAMARRDPRVRAVRRKGKRGRGSACLDGMRLALEDPRVRCVVEMDADFSHDPKELPGLVAALSDCDVAVRSRYLAGSRILDWPIQRRVFSRLSNLFARTVLGVPLADMTNGYRAYSRKAAEALEPEKIGSSGYIVLSEIAYQLHRKGLSFLELPSVFVNRRRGQSNLSLREILDALLGVVRLRLR